MILLSGYTMRFCGDLNFRIPVSVLINYFSYNKLFTMNNDTRLVIRICLSLLSLLLVLYKCTQRDKQFDHIQKEAEQSIQQQSQQAIQTPSPQDLEQLQQQSQNIWTPAAEKTLYDSIYDSARKFKVDDNARVAFAECCVSRIKQLFPKGLDIGKVPDSVKRTMSNIMSE